MSVILDHSEALGVIRMHGEIDITSAAELKKLLLQARTSGKELRVDMERAAELDFTALQLLLGAERKALRKADYEAVEAVDGKDGRGRVSGAKFDLIITDLNMPTRTASK